MLTAKEAKELMPSNLITTILKEVELAIAEAAKKDLKSLRFSSATTREERFAWIREYVYKKSKVTPLNKVIEILGAHGFVCKTLYEERQFVDMDVIITWA